MASEGSDILAEAAIMASNHRLAAYEVLLLCSGATKQSSAAADLTKTNFLERVRANLEITLKQHTFLLKC